MKRSISYLAFCFCFVLFALLGGCEASKTFYESCATGSECPDGWVCPDPGEQGNGKIGHACTPVCENDADCKRLTNRTDVMCYRNFCAIECSKHADCPLSQPICRGANPSCFGVDLGQLWCATEDFSCAE